MKILSSTDVSLTWIPVLDVNTSATQLNVTALPLESALQKPSGKILHSSGSAHISSLTPFTQYKLVVQEKNNDTVLAEIGPIRTWPSGNLHSCYCYFE